MNRALLLASGTAGLIAITAGCGWGGDYYGSGFEGSEVRQVDRTFVELRNQSVADVLVDVGFARTMTMTCDRELLRLLQTEVRDGVLYIVHEDDATLHPRATCESYITTPRLDGIAQYGRGHITTDEQLTGLEYIESYGFGDVEARQIDTDRLEILAGAFGDIVVAGEANEVFIELTGQGTVDATDLEVDSVTVRGTGTGTVRVNTDGAVSVNISGPGDVVISGEPDEMDLNDDGPGDIIFD